MASEVNSRTPEEIKKGLECCLSRFFAQCDACPYSDKGCDTALRVDTLAYIQQLEAGIDRIYKHVDVLRGLPEKIQQLERERDALVDAVQPKWVSVDERLPEDGVRILAFSPKGFHVLYRYGSEWCIETRGYTGVAFYHVTHWMPLPEPPKEV